VKRAVTVMSFLILAAAFTIRAGEVAATGEDLFKWGEYDSLIRLLDPVEMGTRPATAADSADRAKAYLFLGVAFYATGKPASADSAFASACSLDPQVKLDRFYVTEEIANHFQDIALDGIRRSQSGNALAAASAERSARTSHAGVSGRPPRIEREGKEWVWWGLGAAALAAAGGGIILFMNHDKPASDNVTTIDARR
jgi:hypothetical protein